MLVIVVGVKFRTAYVVVKCVNIFSQDLVLGFRPEFCRRFGVFWSAGVSCDAFTQLLLKVRMTTSHQRIIVGYK
jgi:hypothetical protein